LDIDSIVQIVVEQGAIDGLTLDPAMVQAVAVAMLPPLVPPVNGKADDSISIVFGVVFVPKQISSGKDGQTATPNIVQVQGQLTFHVVKEGIVGFDQTFLAQVSFWYDKDTRTVASQPMLGIQEAAVKDFFTKFVQLQGFLQILAGCTMEKDAENKRSIPAWRTLFTAQVAGGVQSVFKLFGDKGLQVVLQGQVGSTAGNGQLTLDRSVGIGLQWEF
jgi:hypothetical protein